MNDLTFNRVPIDGEREPTPSMAGEPPVMAGREEVPFVVRYLRILKRRKWLILGSIAVAAILGLVVTLLLTPLYTARATLEIQRENYRILQGVQGVEPEASSVDLEFYQTQYGLLRARSLAERVATDLRLYNDPNFFETFGADETAQQIREAGPAGGTDQASRQQRVRSAGSILLENMSLSPVRMSRLVEVQFTSPDPNLSARVVNAWTRDFIEMTLERKFEATSYARQFLEQRLEQLRQRLEESERLLVSYAARQRIINIPSGTTAGPNGQTTVERPLVAEDLAALNRELNEATAARVAAQSRLRTAGGSTAEALQNQAISSLRERRAELAAEYARLTTQFDEQYPPAQALANQMRDIDRSIAREEGRVRSAVQEAYRAASEREETLRGRVDGLQSDLLNLRSRTIQYNIYQRDVDTNRELYDGLLQRYKEIGIAGGVGVNNVAVVDPAQVPGQPSSPNLILNVLIALLLGGVIGAGLALALEQIDETISDPTDLEPAMGLPLLGTIPKSETDDAIAELEDPKSPLVEAYLSTQTRLAFTTDHGIPRTLTVTSTRPAEGKSTTSYALARSLARTGKRVVLVDADMRSPGLHHVFGVGNDRGLSNYLTGDDDLGTLVHRNFPNGIALLSAGPTPPNAAELLTGDRISRLIQELSGMFDHVILDVPPVMGLADTPLVASLVEGVIFVVESHGTRLNMARVAVGRLQSANARVLGALLTKFQARRAHYGYGYEYGYGYGEGAKKSA